MREGRTQLLATTEAKAELRRKPMREGTTWLMTRAVPGTTAALLETMGVVEKNSSVHSPDSK